MKKVLFLLVSLSILLMSMRSSGHECITKDGYCKGKLLAGRVKVVEYNADFKVKVVDSYPDLLVKVKEYYAKSPGEWTFVENNSDFTIQFVDSYPDFTIKYTDSYPKVERPCR